MRVALAGALADGFLSFFRAALSEPQLREGHSKRWCIAEFAIRGQGEMAVRELSGAAFCGSKLELSLLRGSDEAPSLWPCLPSPAAIAAVKGSGNSGR